MHRYDPSRRLLGVALAGLAGFTDALGFLTAGGYFVSFMSGNTTRLGVDLARDWSLAILPALLIAGFVFGVVVGALVAERAGARRKTIVIGMAGGLLILAAIAAQIGSDRIYLAFTLVAMGALNNAFSRKGAVLVGVTYMTGALVRFGQGLAAHLSGHAQPGWLWNGGLWLGLAIGATAGAYSWSRIEGQAAWIAAGFALILLVCAWQIERRTPQSAS